MELANVEMANVLGCSALAKEDRHDTRSRTPRHDDGRASQCCCRRRGVAPDRRWPSGLAGTFIVRPCEPERCPAIMMMASVGSDPWICNVSHSGPFALLAHYRIHCDHHCLPWTTTAAGAAAATTYPRASAAPAVPRAASPELPLATVTTAVRRRRARHPLVTCTCSPWSCSSRTRRHHSRTDNLLRPRRLTVRHRLRHRTTTTSKPEPRRSRCRRLVNGR